MKKLFTLFAFATLLATTSAHAQQLPDTCNYFNMAQKADSFFFAYINSYGLSFWPPIDHGTILGVNCSDPGTGNLSRNITYHQSGTNMPDFWQELNASSCYRVGNFVYVESTENWKPNQAWTLFGHVRCSCQKRTNPPWDTGSCNWF